MDIEKGRETKSDQGSEIKIIAAADVPKLEIVTGYLAKVECPYNSKTLAMYTGAEFSCLNSKMADTKQKTGGGHTSLTFSINGQSMQEIEWQGILRSNKRETHSGITPPEERKDGSSKHQRLVCKSPQGKRCIGYTISCKFTQNNM